jgi:hypothetical protein
MESGDRYQEGQTIPAFIRWEDFSGRGSITIVSDRAFRWEIAGGFWRKGVSGTAGCGGLLGISTDGVMTINLGQSLLAVQTEQGFVQAFSRAKADYDLELEEEEEPKRGFVPSKFLKIGDQPTLKQILLFQLVNQIDDDRHLDFRVGDFVSLAEDGCSYCGESNGREQPDRQPSPVMLFRSLGRDEIEGVCLAHVVELLREFSPALYDAVSPYTYYPADASFENVWDLVQDYVMQPKSEIRARLAASA